MNTALVYQLAGSWSQFLDTSVDSQLDISQFQIMTLIHWISLRHFIQIKSSAFQCSVLTPCHSNLSTANLHLSHFFHNFCTLQTNILSYGSSISPNSASLLETNHIPSLVFSWLRGGWLLALAQQLHSYKDCSKGFFKINWYSFGICMCKHSNALCQSVT